MYPIGPLVLQFIIVKATFLMLVATTLNIWATLASQLRDRLQEPGTVRTVNGAGGNFLIAAGRLTAAARRA